MEPPAEGSLDREQFLRVVECLSAETPAGLAGDCFAYYSPLSVDLVSPALFEGSLGDLAALYERDDLLRPGGSQGSPTNIWPADHSWFVYTDGDLWGTRVSGTKRLIAQLQVDKNLDTVVLNV